MDATIKGKAHGTSSENEAARIAASTKSGFYATKETTLITASTNTALTALTGCSDFFTPLPESRASFMEIYSSKTITVRFRTLANAATATASLHAFKILGNTRRVFSMIADITEVYLSNSSGATSDIEVSAI